MLTLSIAACGGGSNPTGTEANGSYAIKVVSARFPTRQQLGETSLLELKIRNSGRRTVPALAVTISIAGREGQSSSLPFGVRDQEPGLAQPDRPVWVLAEHYPKRAEETASAGAEGASRKTFDFGPLKPGAETNAVWKLSAVKAGKFTVLYKVDAGLYGGARAETSGGVRPGGSFRVTISAAAPQLRVTGSGKVVTLPSARGR